MATSLSRQHKSTVLNLTQQNSLHHEAFPFSIYHRDPFYFCCGAYLYGVQFLFLHCLVSIESNHLYVTTHSCLGQRYCQVALVNSKSLMHLSDIYRTQRKLSSSEPSYGVGSPSVTRISFIQTIFSWQALPGTKVSFSVPDNWAGGRIWVGDLSYGMTTALIS